MPHWLNEPFRDRIQGLSLLIVLCFLAVLSLSSQSAASYPSYFLALAMLLTCRSWNDVFRIGLVWSVLALLVYLTLSALWSDPFDARKAGGTLVRALLVFTFVVAMAECQQRGRIRRWLGRGLALVGVVVIATALALFVVDRPEDGRLNGLGQLDTHVVAALVYGVVLIFVVESLMLEEQPVWRLLAGVSVCLIVLAVYLSDSRNAWVSVLIGVSVFVAASKIPDRQQFAMAVLSLVLLLLVALLVLLANEATRDIVLPRGDSFRLNIWSAVSQRVLDGGPWFGLGINTSDRLVLGGESFSHPHSMYLSVAFQGGVVGLLLFVWLIVYALRTLYLNYERNDAKLAMGILAIALPSYLLDGHELIDKVGETWFLFWLPIGIGLGLRWSRPSQDALTD